MCFTREKSRLNHDITTEPRLDYSMDVNNWLNSNYIATIKEY